MEEADDVVSKLAKGLARSGLKEKEAFLIKQLNARPDLMRRLEDIVIEEAPMRFDTKLGDDFDIEKNQYKFVVTYNWRIRMITDEERVQRYVDRRYEEFASRFPTSSEIEDQYREHERAKAWELVRQGVKL